MHRTASNCSPLPIGIGFGWPLGGPRATQGPRTRCPRFTPSVDWWKGFICNKNVKKAGWGSLAEGHRQRVVGIAAIADIAASPLRSGKQKNYHGGAETRRTAKENRRDRAKSPTSHGIGKGKTLPLINTDDTDRKSKNLLSWKVGGPWSRALWRGEWSDVIL